MKTNIKDNINLDQIWKELVKEADLSGDIGIYIRRTIPNSKCDLFLGIEKPSYKKLFILKADKTSIEPAKNLPESKGILTKTAILPHEHENKESLIILLKEERFYDVFTSLVVDIIASLEEITDDAEAVRTLILRLKKWQSFMEQYTEGLGEETVRGLFGELYFLSDFLIPKCDIQGIKSWKGFQSTNQDFYFPNGAIEVKTTIGREPQSLRIASERQLDKGGYPNLFLYHIVLEKNEQLGKSLPELITDIRKKIAGNEELINYFESGLFTAGYIDTQKDKYRSNFLVRNKAFYEVSDSFPKITESDLPNGIGDVQYGVNVSECRHYTVDEDKIVELLKYE